MSGASPYKAACCRQCASVQPCTAAVWRRALKKSNSRVYVEKLVPALRPRRRDEAGAHALRLEKHVRPLHHAHAVHLQCRWRGRSGACSQPWGGAAWQRQLEGAQPARQGLQVLRRVGRVWHASGQQLA